MMNSRRICPADGSQYKDSAVGLVFMESAAGLAMETSKVESAVRNQAEAKLNQLEHTDGLSPAVARYQQLDNQSQDTSRELQWIKSQASLLLYIQSTWYPYARKAKVAKLGNQTQATAHPVESFYEPAVAMNPVASFAYPVDMESSRKKADVMESYNPDARYPVVVFEDSAEAQSSSRVESAAKQLTIYESWMSTAERNSNGKNA
ncbi:hypothetical protein F511_12921 [Dorcoceras hygrometricum]|uniref:Uncharacterized protein n=1 Tax=Dorcoceras hygrometricum TaxID=472368 RepID=A0A2Z7BRD0_9LAMI|nr:hypothetical protein F511_12921 [Dorcoceras hygrometricum]